MLNLKTAKVPGLTVPNNLLSTADEVIANSRVNCCTCSRRVLADTVAKVESCRATDFSRNYETETIADLYSVTHISEVACEFNVRR